MFARRTLRPALPSNLRVTPLAKQQFGVGTHRIETDCIAAIAGKFLPRHFGLEVMATPVLGSAFGTGELHFPV